MGPPNTFTSASAASAGAMAAQLRQMILYHLDNNLGDNALFLAGRLHCIEPRSPDAVHLLALSHLRLGQHRAAYDYCRITALRGAHLGCAYVFAQACLALRRHADGVAALERTRALWSSKHAASSRCDDATRTFLPDAAAAFCLLGKLLWANGDAKRAVECYVEALKLNPFMWDAFERLCETSTPVRPAAIFKSNPELLAFVSAARQGGDETSSATSQSTTHASKMPNWQSLAHDPFSSRLPSDGHGGLGSSNAVSKLNMGAPTFSTLPDIALDAETPTSQNGFDDPLGVNVQSGLGNMYGMEPPDAPVRRSRLESANGDLSRLQLGGARSRSKASSSEVSDAAEGRKASSLHVAHPKRTISGHSAHNSSTTIGNGNGNGTSNSRPTIVDMHMPVSDATAAPQRRSVRLFKRDKDPSAPAVAPAAPTKDLREIRKVRATGVRGRSAAPSTTTSTASTVGRVVSGNRKPADGADNTLKEVRSHVPSGEVAASVPSRRCTTDASQDREVMRELLDLMAKLGCGYHALSRYECGAALQHFQSVPAQHRDSPWVLAQMGKAQYEQSSYGEAEKSFARVRKLCPSRLQDMDVYSTVLWHLKSDTELAFLSHELVEAERHSAQAWCTVGNSFSLSREHEQALRCFRRATQLDPRFAYGFTLQGHEHVENEEYDKALHAYRRAIAVDARHYNGWYGLGKVYEKLGKYDMAEAHYRRAADINPHNAIIVVCIGVVLERQKRPHLALQQFERACELAPASAISRFRKARVLLSLRQPRDALDEFLQLKDLVPDESNVHFMLGRTYKMLRDRPRAIRSFTIAMNLDPKAGPYIKEAMEDLDEEDDDDDQDMDDVEQM